MRPAPLQLGPPLLGHTADVTVVAFHPSHPPGQVLLTASLDGTLRAWWGAVIQLPVHPQLATAWLHVHATLEPPIKW
jgi:WD40 repeat protein